MLLYSRLVTNAIDCELDSQTRKCNILKFSFPRSGNDANYGVEFRQSIRNASLIRQKVVNVSVLMKTKYLYNKFPGTKSTKFPLPTLLCAGYSVKVKKRKNIRCSAVNPRLFFIFCKIKV